MFYFNSLLLENLHAVLRRSRRELSMGVFGGDPLKLSRMCRLADRVLVCDLVTLCNALRLSLSSFFTTDERVRMVGERADYVIASPDFRAVAFHGEALQRLYGPGGVSRYATQQDFAEAVSISHVTVRHVLRGETSLRVSQLLGLCNRFALPLSFFLEDANRDFPPQDGAGVHADELAPRTPSEVREPDFPPPAVEPPAPARNSSPRVNTFGMGRPRRGDAVRLERKAVLTDAVPLAEVAAGMEQVREWVFRYSLLDRLPLMRGISRTEMLGTVGLSSTTCYRNGDLLVRHFVTICNRFEVSVRHFLGRTQQPLREWPYYHSAAFRTVVFRPQQLREWFTEGGQPGLTGLRREDWQTASGISAHRLAGWMKAETSSLRLSDLMTLCNRFHLSPYLLLDDPNEVPSDATAYERVVDSNQLLLAEVYRLRKQLREAHRRPNSFQNGNSWVGEEPIEE
jgi:transcriptional regulator with XRE-family HTH domain